MSKSDVPPKGERPMLFGLKPVGSPGLLTRILDTVWLDADLTEEVQEAHRIAKIRLRAVYEELESLRQRVHEQQNVQQVESDLIVAKNQIKLLKLALQKAFEEKKNLTRRSAEQLKCARSTSRSSEELLAAKQEMYDQVFLVAQSRYKHIQQLYKEVALLKASQSALQDQLRQQGQLIKKLSMQNRELLDPSTELEDERRHSAKLTQTVEWACAEIKRLSEQLGEKQN